MSILFFTKHLVDATGFVQAFGPDSEPESLNADDNRQCGSSDMHETYIVLAASGNIR